MISSPENSLREHLGREEERCREFVQFWLYKENSSVFRFACRPHWSQQVEPFPIQYREFQRQYYRRPDGAVVHGCKETGDKSDRPYFITNRPR